MPDKEHLTSVFTALSSLSLTKHDEKESSSKKTQHIESTATKEENKIFYGRLKIN